MIINLMKLFLQLAFIPKALELFQKRTRELFLELTKLLSKLLELFLQQGGLFL